MISDFIVAYGCQSNNGLENRLESISKSNTLSYINKPEKIEYKPQDYNKYLNLHEFHKINASRNIYLKHPIN